MSFGLVRFRHWVQDVLPVKVARVFENNSSEGEKRDGESLLADAGLARQWEQMKPKRTAHREIARVFSVASISSQDGARQMWRMPFQLKAASTLPSGENLDCSKPGP